MGKPLYLLNPNYLGSSQSHLLTCEEKTGLWFRQRLKLWSSHAQG